MADRALDALHAAVGDAVRPASDTDTVAGVPAGYVATPGTTAETGAVLRAAAAHDLAVVVRGAGTKLSWGLPPRRLDLVVDTRRLAGVVEHVAGDLVAVVRAGTPMAELQGNLAPAGQQLALDTTVPGATVGGVVAVGAAGPRRLAYGGVRDLIIGITVVRADGVVAHAGGKVVKNVAGYDLGRLLAGSYGTLALITECAFRLHPLPTTTAYVCRRVDDPAAAGALAAAIRAGQIAASAVEVEAAVGGGYEVCVLLEGVPEGVDGRVAAARRLLGGDPEVSADAPAWWSAYPWRPGDTGLKLTTVLSRIPDLLTAARASGDRHGSGVAVRGSIGTGVLYAALPAATDARVVTAVVADLRTAARGCGGHAVVLTAPPAVRDGVDMWGPVDGLDLMRRVKQQFDPDARLAPGRFVGGI